MLHQAEIIMIHQQYNDAKQTQPPPPQLESQQTQSQSQQSQSPPQPPITDTATHVPSSPSHPSSTHTTIYQQRLNEKDEEITRLKQLLKTSKRNAKAKHTDIIAANMEVQC